MKNILKYIILVLVFITTKGIAQTPENIVKKDTTITGNLTLVATKSIILSPNTHIVAGSNFVAKIGLDNGGGIIVPTPYVEVMPSGENYIFTRTFQTPMKNVAEIKKSNDVAESITYFDGLGRPMQNIAIKASPTGQDIITHIGYDGLGRQDKEYLPYLDTAGAIASYRTDASLNTNNYYSLHYPTDINGADSNPFSEKKLEASPLNRVLKQAAPGTSWKMDSGHEIKLDYQTNGEADAVKLYKATATWQPAQGLYDISFVDAGSYETKELYKNVTFDENSGANLSESAGSTVEFKNKEGQVVLKRTYDLGERHDTYYVYDVYGNLTYVLPPKVTGVNDEVLNGLCYQYKYDDRNRLVEKKLPGKQWEFIVYDKLDRPVAIGPTFSPFKNDSAEGWLITKYDAFGRPIYTGWNSQSSSSVTRKALQNAQNIKTTLFETKQTSGTIDGIAVNYSNTIEPTNFKLLTVNYYDDYTYPNVTAKPTTIEGDSVLANTKGLATGNWTRVITTADATAGETITNFYDAKARPIRMHLQNHISGYIITDSKLDFTGKALYTITKHKRTSGDNEITIREDFTYSPQNRLLTHTHQINGGAVELLADNTYDDLGQLIIKKVGNSTGNPLQKVHFSYNIRGWLTRINNIDNLQQNSDPKDLFAFKINYNNQPDNPNVKALFNGNIAETFWRTGADNAERGYGYEYDDLNRLSAAIYEKNGVITEMYNENLSYDKNGNIEFLNRNGDIDPQIGTNLIDALVYTYPPNSNQLSKVKDNSNNSSGFNDFNTNGDDYTYDENGNMIIDKNKNITAITYNQLNLPKKITFGATGSIEYIYNAAGQKLEKIVTDNGVVTSTNYLGGFQYKNNVLEFFPTAEGYVKNENGALSYVFQYKDHLGNVRVSYAKNPQTQVLEITEENNYYPFGLKHKGYNDYLPIANKYKYNGKELQDELGLNMYDYGARNYDPALGRWMNIDPLAEKSRRFSPYTYALNNPIFFIDPDGMMASPPDWYIDDRTGKVLGQDGASTNNVRLIDSNNFNDVKEANGGATTSAEATAQLQSSDMSTLVTVNDTQIQNELQQVNDQSRNIEHQTNIVLDRTSGEVKAVRGEPGVDGLTSMNYETRTNKDGVSYNTQGGNLLLGQAHGHNLIKDSNKVNIPGTSEVDKNTAASSGVTIYSIDAYNTPVGGQAQINRVTPAGVQTNGVGTTKGATGTGTFNIGMDALQRWSGF